MAVAGAVVLVASEVSIATVVGVTAAAVAVAVAVAVAELIDLT